MSVIKPLKVTKFEKVLKIFLCSWSLKWFKFFLIAVFGLEQQNLLKQTPTAKIKSFQITVDAIWHLLKTVKFGVIFDFVSFPLYLY